MIQFPFSIFKSHRADPDQTASQQPFTNITFWWLTVSSRRLPLKSIRFVITISIEFLFSFVCLGLGDESQETEAEKKCIESSKNGKIMINMYLLVNKENVHSYYISPNWLSRFIEGIRPPPAEPSTTALPLLLQLHPALI